jgi:hypothetical protein
VQLHDSQGVSDEEYEQYEAAIKLEEEEEAAARREPKKKAKKRGPEGTLES